MIKPLTGRKEISLGRRKKDEANDKRNDQSFEAFTDELTACSGFERKPGDCSGKEKEQCHSPLCAEDDQHNQTCVLFPTPDTPVERIVNIECVGIKYPQHGQYSQPVEVVEPSCIWCALNSY